MTPLPKECGCKIVLMDTEINYCALHRSAPALLEALKKIARDIDRQDALSESLFQKAEAAIAEAGKP